MECEGGAPRETRYGITWPLGWPSRRLQRWMAEQSPRQLVIHMLCWALLADQELSDTDELDVLFDLAQQHLVSVECSIPPGAPRAM
ncbi:MAG: hypothetical protein ACRDF8_11970 [Chloroflexota bacterium]